MDFVKSMVWLMSHPKLGDTVRWECSVCIRHEDVTQPISCNIPWQSMKVSPQRRSSLFCPDLEGFIEIVNSYNCRFFTYPQDTLAAFTGIFSSLNHSFVDGFYGGLPIMFFDIALLWQPVGSLERRLSTQPSTAESPPSWSWAGWHGEVSLNLDAFRPYIQRPGDRSMRTKSTRPLVDWYGYDRRTKIKWRIKSSWCKFAFLYANTETIPPGDWTRHLEHYKDWDSSGIMHYYKHPAAPDTKLWFPIPLGNTNTQPRSQLDCLLTCHTQRTHLSIGRKCNSHHEKSYRALRTKEDEWAGIIYLQKEASGEQICVIGETCELALLSITEKTRWCDFDQSVWHWETIPPRFCYPEDRPSRRIGSRAIYNALCIEWRDGIAYRRALAQVKKNVWEKQEREDFELILG